MTEREAIEILGRPFSMQEAPKEILDAHRLAISALEKQEQDNNKSCNTCKYKNLPVSEFPCDECYFASDLEDYYEPYTEEEA